MTELTAALRARFFFLLLLGPLVSAGGCQKQPAAEAPAADNTPEIFVQLGHSGSVKSLAVSPDGRYFLSGSDDHTVKLWDLKSRRLVRTWRGDMLGIRGDGGLTVSYAPDGRRFLVNSWYGDVVVIEMSTGKPVAAFEHPAMSFAVFSPNGEYVLTGSYNGTVKLWNLAGAEEEQTYELSSSGVSSGAFSRNGSLVACGDAGGVIHLLDVENEERVATMQADGPTIYSVAFSSDGARLTSVNSAGTVVTWDVQARKRLGQFVTGAHLMGPSVAFTPDGRYVTVHGAPLGTISLWSVETGARVKEHSGPGGTVDAAVFSPDGSLLLLGGSDNTVDVYDITTGMKRFSFPGQTRYAKAVASSPDGSMLLSATVEWFSSSNITINQWDAGNGLLKGHTAIPATFDIALSPDLGSAFSLRTVWNLEKGTKIRDVPGEGEAEISVYSPDGASVLTGDLQGNVQIVELSSGRRLLAIKAHRDQLSALAFSRDGKYFATGSSDNSENLKVWSASDGRIVRSFDKNTEFISAIAFLPDGRHILTGNPSADAVMRLWDISTGDVVKTFTGHTNDINTIAVSDDGTFAVSGGRDTKLRMWDMTSGDERRTFTGHADDIRAIVISRDGRRIVSVSDDGTTRLWDVAGGTEIAQFVGFDDGEWVVMTPDGFFNASPGGARYLNVRIGTDVYSVDNFFEKFFDPVRVAAVLGGGAAATGPGPDIRKGVLPPPSVRIVSPAPNAVRTTDTVTIAVSATDMGGGVDEIRLYQNGKVVGEDTRGMKPVARAKETVRTYTPILVEGANTFRAVAFSKDRTESFPAEVVVMLEAPQQAVSLHVVAIGINEYKNRALNLNYAQPDAQGIVDFFRRSGTRLFRTVEIKEVYNEQATKENILSTVAALRNTRPQDAVVMYLAGHGESIGDQWYFLPHELTHPEREDDVRTMAVSSEELRKGMREIKAQKVLLLIDACKAGAVLVAFRGFEDRKALSQLSRSTGVHIVAASTKDQFAAEVKDLGHGVFTYTLLAGLNGEAARANETVTVRKLMGYVEETLPELTKRYKQEAQYPVVDSRGMDFPLVLVR